MMPVHELPDFAGIVLGSFTQINQHRLISWLQFPLAPLQVLLCHFQNLLISVSSFAVVRVPLVIIITTSSADGVSAGAGAACNRVGCAQAGQSARRQQHLVDTVYGGLLSSLSSAQHHVSKW